MKKAIIPALGILLITGLCFTGYYFYGEMKNAENSRPVPENIEYLDSVAAIESQPYGYGESVKLSDSELLSYRQGVGSIDFSDVAVPGHKLKNYTGMEEVVAGVLAKEKDGRYICNISWNNGISQIDYDALSIAAGQIYESELNKSEPGRYEVTISRPEGNAMAEAGIPAYWDLDENRFLTIWTTCEVVDFKAETKTTTLEPFTLYYELNYLNLK